MSDRGGWPVIEHLKSLAAAAAPVLPGLLGRLLFHFDQARRGHRPAVGWLLAVEVAIAVPMGFLGQAVAEWFSLTGNVAFGCAIAVAYLGPRLLDLAFERWWTTRKEPTK